MDWSKRRFLLAIAVLAACVLSCLLWLHANYPFVDRDDYDAVASAFMSSLMENNARTAKALTHPEQWDRIDTWMAEHQAFHCPFSLDLEDWALLFEDSYKVGDQTVHFNYYHYQCPDGGYLFIVEDITLHQTEEGYQVVDWGQACEKWDWEWQNERGTPHCR